MRDMMRRFLPETAARAVSAASREPSACGKGRTFFRIRFEERFLGIWREMQLSQQGEAPDDQTPSLLRPQR